jgi:hypothetical protein
MNGEENINQVPKNNDTPEDVNENTSQEQAIEQSTQSENMEVHHHPDLHHKRKHFKEYFLEFLMIFLAVTMGFIAENMRENISENNISKDMAENLYQEVYADFLVVQQKIAFRQDKMQQLSYFVSYVKDSSLTNISPRFSPSFFWSFIANSATYFQPKDGTINQLVNSGALRYFKSRKLQANIAALSAAIAEVRKRNDVEINFTEFQAREFAIKYFDFDWLEQVSQHGKLNTLQLVKMFHDDLPQLPSKIKNAQHFNKEEAASLASYFLLLVRSTVSAQYTDYLKANHELLQTLRNEYNLKNE